MIASVLEYGDKAQALSISCHVLVGPFRNVKFGWVWLSVSGFTRRLVGYSYSAVASQHGALQQWHETLTAC